MYRIAICEDERNIRGALVSLCNEILNEISIEHSVTEFSSAEELETELSDNPDAFDILLLDIQMDQKNGMELAKEQREKGNRISIIFITGCEEYLKEGYSVQPIQYLLKPVRKEELDRALKTDIRLNYTQKIIVLRKGVKTTALTVKDVVYIESFNHTLVIHMAGGDLSFPQTLSEITQALPENTFCQIHKSYLVNMEHIMELTRSEAVLSNGVKLPVGRKYYNDAQLKFVRYINL